MSARKDEKSSPLSPEGDTGAKSPLSAGAFSAAGSANELPSIPSPDTQPDIEPERAEPARIEPPLQGSYRSFEPVRAAQPRSTIATTTLRFSRREDAPEVEMTADDDSAAAASARRRRFALLAASVALAAAFGAGAGALGAWSLTPEPPAPPPAPVVAAAVPDTKPLQKTIAQLRAEVTSLRSSVEVREPQHHGAIQQNLRSARSHRARAGRSGDEAQQGGRGVGPYRQAHRQYRQAHRYPAEGHHWLDQSAHADRIGRRRSRRCRCRAGSCATCRAAWRCCRAGSGWSKSNPATSSRDSAGSTRSAARTGIGW